MFQFNVLWLNPTNPDTFPEGFLDALDDPVVVQFLQQKQAHDPLEGRLRARMQAERLQPLASLDDEDADETELKVNNTPYSEEELKEATQFLRLTVRIVLLRAYATTDTVIQAQDRLELVLDYLRNKYAYCFWCGTQYDDQDDLETSCPGPDEESHD